MITRLESYTKDAAQGGRRRTPGRRLKMLRPRSARTPGDVTLGLCASAYLALVLFDDVESPLLSMALIVLVAYELIQPHVRNR